TGSFWKNAKTARRFNWRRMTTWPATSTPWTWKTDLAMSRPIVVIVCMDAPPNRGSFNSAHIFGTHVPVEEPSTASEPDVRVDRPQPRGSGQHYRCDAWTRLGHRRENEHG